MRGSWMLLGSLAAACGGAHAQVVAAGVPLHLKLEKTMHVSLGAPVQARVTDAVYVVDRMVIPAGAEVLGHVAALRPVHGRVLVEARLNGDVTPLRMPVVLFDTLRLPGGRELRMTAHAEVRDVKFVRFESAGQRTSLWEMGKAAVRQQIQEAHDMVFAAPGPKDRALRLLYSQLPYHPLRVWSGTGMIADLDAPLAMSMPEVAAVERSPAGSLDKVRVQARLAVGVTSATAKHGDAVTALVTKPVLDASGKLVVPEGAALEGLVAQARGARSFGRNGTLRLGFRGLKDEGESAAVQGTVVGAEGNSGANETVDREGNVQAHPDKHRFVAPLLLAWSAMAAGDGAEHGHSMGAGNGAVSGNGFGIVARVITMATTARPVAYSFGAYAFAKSIYFRFLTRGHEVEFPQDTVVEVELAQRAADAPAAVTR